MKLLKNNKFTAHKKIIKINTETEIRILLWKSKTYHDSYVNKNLPSKKNEVKAERISVWIFPESWKF